MRMRVVLVGVLGAAVVSGSLRSQQVTTAPAPSRADERLAAMSVREKAGQLFVSWILSRADGQQDKRAQMLGWIRDCGLGGVILSLGRVDEAAALVGELQAASKVPLLLASDFEGGVAARLGGATDMGNQMLVGAGGLTRLARAMGEVTGSEALALGIPWVFAPVLDVNSNPLNPIINVRSFGEDPAAVARLGSAFAQGVRNRGAMPCGKHFPGHGDVSSDSHLALPTVPGDGARLRAVELLPFRVAAQQGLESVMTGHLAVPGLGEDPALPATLSQKILVDVLRGELGFRGLVVTDALEMGGVKNAFAPGEVAVRALLAGADVLLMPPDPLAARDAIVAAVESGRVPMARLDGAVLRLLQQKERLGLLASGAHAPAADWQQRLDTEPARAVADEIAQRGITLVRDPQALVPLPRGAWTVVTLTDRAPGEVGVDAAGDALAAELRAQGVEVQQALASDLEPQRLAAATAALRTADRAIVALHVKVREFSGVLGLPPELQQALAALRAESKVVFVSFGSPYVVQQLPATGSYLCAFASGARREQAVARALTGAPITGRLPVSIPGIAAVGSGLTVLPGTDLGRAAPEREGLAAELPQQLENALQEAVQDRAFPGAVALVARRGRVVASAVVGKLRYEDDAQPMRRDTLFDLASLTKVCATTPAVLDLIARGVLQWDAPVARWVPTFVGPGKERVTLRHLLAHTSGLPAHRPFFQTLRGKDAIVGAAAAEPLVGEPGRDVVYSDLGLILTMAIVEAASGQPFAQCVQQRVWTPLGMSGATFGSSDGPPLQAAPTEISSERGGLVQGRVHDENAWAMGGVSGHAGMFATADDVLRLGVALLARGRGVLPPDVVAVALQPQSEVGSRRAFGLDLLQPGTWAGTAPPTNAFGHTGFTGTSVWCDPVHDVCVVLLTNRVYPTRDNPRITGVRRRVHDLVQAAIDR